MKMSRLLLSVLASASASFALASPLSFTIESDHANLLYKVGEEAMFKVTAMRDGKPAPAGDVDVVLDNFGPAVQASNRVDLAKGNPFTVRGKLSEPGFLRLTLKAADAAKVWSVGYEPERIVKGSPSPDDFDAFWSAARAKLAKEVPLDAKMTKIPERSTKDFDYYRISFATFGRRVYGYMSVPTDRSKAPYPVEFQVAAAGFGGWTNDMGGEKNLIKVFFAVYPWAPHWDWQSLGLKTAYDFMNEAYDRRYACGRYCTAGLSKDREDYFFYPVILGIDRAIDWIAARPDVDRSRFWYQGTSQGGGFGFYLTGLNRTFTRAVFYVPAITDTMGCLKGRQSGWPQPIEYHREADRAAVEKTAPYFDGANFASRITCPVRVAVGFADTTCAPCAVYAAYNAIKSEDKGIVHGFGMTHSCFGKFYKELGTWLRRPVRASGSGNPLVYHIDMNAHQMNRAAIERHLAHVASQGYNAILWEIENKVKFACAPKLASKDAFSREEFQEILACADRLGLEAIPLMQTFGHAEYVLGLPEYADMREDPKFDDCYCVLNPKTLAFQRALLDEYLAIFGSRLKRFHLGGDEAEHFHTCAQCKQHDKAALYIGHLEKIAAGLRAKGIRPGVWHDMLQRFDKKGSKFSLLPKDFVLWYWEYFFTGPETALKPNLSWASGAEEAVVAERRGGREVILCSASQCYVDGPFMTRTERHRANVAGLADVARREGMGYCVTSWMCHQGPKDLQYPLYDLGAKRFLNPGAGVEQDWREIVRRYCGDVEVKTLDDLTVWGATSIGTDGREKNEVVPERGKFLRAFRDKPAEAKKKSDWALLEKRYVDGALAKLRTVPDDEMTPYLRRLIEAGELTSEHLGMVAEGVLGRAIRSPQVERVKRFYAQELTPHSVEVVTGKLFNGYVE